MHLPYIHTNIHTYIHTYIHTAAAAAVDGIIPHASMIWYAAYLSICLAALGIVVGCVVFVGLGSLGTYALSCSDYRRPPFLLGEASTHLSTIFVHLNPSIYLYSVLSYFLDHNLISSLPPFCRVIFWLREVLHPQRHCGTEEEGGGDADR